jgi:phosphate transport system protein
MELHFDQELAQLKDNLLRMSALAERSLAQSLKALLQRDDSLALAVDEGDNDLDQLQMDIDEQCIHLIALREPKARDLRFIMMAMKIGAELERIGDQAVNIAHRVEELNKEPSMKLNEDIPRLAKMVHEMIRDAMDSFVYQKPEKARTVIQRDDEADILTKKLHYEFVELMMESPPAINRFLCIMSVAHNLERVADYATNIAEEIIYLYEARDIRHNNDTMPLKK